MIERGAIHWVALPEPVGSGPGFRRPALVISAARFNASRISTVIVASISSNLKLADAPGNVVVPAATSGLPRDSVINVTRLYTIDRRLLGDVVGMLDFSTLTPDQLATAVDDFGVLLEEAKDRAPDQISDSVDLTAAAFGPFSGALADANYVVFDVDVSVFNALGSPELEAANLEIAIYNEESCGIQRDDLESGPDGGDPGLPEEGTVRDAAVAGLVDSGFTQEEAECLINHPEIMDPATFEDEQLLLELLSRCGISLERLAELGG